MNVSAILIFSTFVALTLGITYWASKRMHSSADFFTAGGSITGGQNALAIVGDYMSASALLGVSALTFTNGFDGLIYALCAFMGWPVVMFLLAEKMRNLGRFTMSDIIAFRLEDRPMRVFSAISSLIIVLFYLTVQMVGAGQLIQLLLNIDYSIAVWGVGALMMVYVIFGGMIATTWVQIFKAVLMIFTCVLLAVLALWQFGFDSAAIIDRAVSYHEAGEAVTGPWKLLSNPISGISLALSLVFGIAGLPHILMRFFTVPNAKAARRSVFIATGLTGILFVSICFLGLSAMAILPANPEFYVDGQVGGAIVGGSNMPLMHLSVALGGNLLFGFLSAIAFSTILAVVAGLTLAGTSAISYDLYATVIKRGNVTPKKAMQVNRIAAFGIGLVAILLGLTFRDQNLAFLVALAFAIAASANFPVLAMVLYWPSLTTRGALAGGIAGLGSAVGLVIVSPAVWVKVLGFEQAIFPYDYPTLISMPLTFIVTYVVSKTDKSGRAVKDRSGFLGQEIRAETGIGIAPSAAH